MMRWTIEGSTLNCLAILRAPLLKYFRARMTCAPCKHSRSQEQLVGNYCDGITHACGVTWAMFATSPASVPPTAQVIAPASIF